MGYDPDGRTLKINEAEAETIRALYDGLRNTLQSKEEPSWS